ncbi:MAG: FtsX-like permease family protein, partial [Clostridia bacterium]|nr:FtsX-like permease family protein [Clostridia bacterium]
NEKTISMVKVLGFDNGEIARLYIVATSIVLIVADAVSVFIGAAVMKSVWKVMMASYSGYFEFVMNPMDYVKMFLFVLAGYLFVTVLDFRRIKKIPMNEALKNME